MVMFLFFSIIGRKVYRGIPSRLEGGCAQPEGLSILLVIASASVSSSDGKDLLRYPNL